jgi:ATP phosphoribosyltransferase regulatory subunit
MLSNNNQLLRGRQAKTFEHLRHKTLALLEKQGFEIVMPPVMDNASHLSVLPGRDLQAVTLQAQGLTGLAEYARADITPQTARLDAMRFLQEGAEVSVEAGDVARMCYALPALHARPRHILSTREPWYVGAEIYGNGSIEADLEILGLMLDCARLATDSCLYVGLGHAGIYPILFEQSGLPDDLREPLHSAIARKSMDDIQRLSAAASDGPARHMLRALATLYGEQALNTARSLLSEPGLKSKDMANETLGKLSAMLDDLEEYKSALESSEHNVQAHIDLGDTAGFDYHTGVVFSVYAAGCGESLVYGGRYDGLAKVFGLKGERPAVGFSAELRLLSAMACADL